MANRREKLDQSVAISRRPSHFEMTNAFAATQVDSPIELLSIFEITPDPRQPRRVAPPIVRIRWDGSPRSLRDQIFEPWLERVCLETGMKQDQAWQWLAKIVDGQESKRADEGEDYLPRAAEASLLRVLDLAASIKAKQLINPITVYRDGSGGQYRIETGERRWLAFHLLHLLYESRWDLIPARIVPFPDVWKQAAENNARDNLNAVGKARQFALLLMDLYPNTPFQPLGAFEHEQDFYSQIADGSQFPIPRGAGDKLVAAIGVQNTRQLRDLRRLLRVPEFMWDAADEHNWREGRIRNLLEEADGDESYLERLFILELARDHNGIDDERNPPTPEQLALADDPEQREARKKMLLKMRGTVISPEERKEVNRLLKLLETIEELDPRWSRPEMLRELDDLAAMLREIADRCDRLAARQRP